MKKIILTVAAVFVLGFANAQDKKEAKGFGFSKGDIFVEGSMTMSSSNNKNTEVKTNTMDFSPKAGYLVSDNFAVGLNLGLGSDKTTSSLSNTTTKTSSFSIGAFGRYYFLDLGQRFKTYTEFGFNVKNEKDANTPVVKTNTFNIGAGLGMNYFVTPKIAISVGLGNLINYKTTKTDASGDKGNSKMDLNLNVFNNFFNNAATTTFGCMYKF